MDKLLFALKCVFIGVFAVVGYANGRVLAHSDALVTSVADVPAREVALIFGGGMQDAQIMSEFQEDRVLKGIELYTSGKARVLVMTGDDGARRADEVSVMRAYAIERGVPEDAVRVDPHGYRTYESCRRAAQEYGMSDILVVSQSFHLPRIAYLCRHFGVEVVGVSADLREYTGYGKIWGAGLREVLARLKAWREIL